MAHYTHIIHIADLHVRTGNNVQARVEEYAHVFKNFINNIKVLPCVTNGTSVLVIAGDVFHSKCRMESAGTKVFFEWINELLDIIPIIVICGNHDYKQEDTSITDSIEMLITPYKSGQRKHSITYFKNTGIYNYGDIEFGLVSVKDTLKAYNTSGIVDDLPGFPKPNTDKAVALFHGSISQSALPSGTSLTHGYPLDWFEGYKMVILGDNHKQQLNKTGDKLWGYSGSLIQQDFGESTVGHGYILWDLENNSAEKYHIYNTYGSITIKNNKILFNNTTEYDFSDIPSIKHFPKKPKIRVIGTYEHTDDYVNKLNDHDIIPSVIKTKGSVILKGEKDSKIEDKISEISNLNSPEYWEKYLRAQKPVTNIFELLHNIKLFTIQVKDVLPTDIVSSINTRNKGLEDLIDKYTTTFEASKKVSTHKVIFKYMNWEYLMCFAEDNYIDFESFDNKIALLNGANATGKSSFLDVLCIAIFGKPTSLRRDFSGTNMTSKIINDTKQDNVSSFVQFIFEINNTIYEIYRTYICHPNDNDTIQPKVTAIYKYLPKKYVDSDDENVKDDTEEKQIIAEGNVMVDAWVNEYFGTLDEFLMSTILCQTDTTNFFYKKTCEQQAILDKALHMDTVSTFEDVINASVLAHKFIKDKIKTYSDGMRNISNFKVSLEDIQQLQTNYENISSLFESLNLTNQNLLSLIGNKEELGVFIDDINEPEKELKMLIEQVEENDELENKDEIISSLSKSEAIREQLQNVATNLNVDLSKIDSSKKYNLEKYETQLNEHKQTKPQVTAKFSKEHIQERKARYDEWLVFYEHLESAESLEEDYELMKEQMQYLETLNLTKAPVNDDEEYDNKDVELYEELKTQLKQLKETEPQKNYNINIQNVIDKYKKWQSKQVKEWMKNPSTVDKLLKKTVSDLEKLNKELRKLMDEEHIPKPTVDRPIGKLQKTKDTKDDIIRLQKEEIILKRTVEQINNWQKEWDTWNKFVATIPSDTVEELLERQNQLRDYDTTISEKEKEYSNANERHALLSKELIDIEQIEYNPDCYACCKQPHVLRIAVIKNELKQLDTTSKKLKKYLQKTGSLTEIRAELKEINKNLPIREKYERKYQHMEEENTVIQQSIIDHSKEKIRLEKLAQIWWALYDIWNDKVIECKSKEAEYQKLIETMKQFQSEYDVYSKEYEAAIKDKEIAETYNIWKAKYDEVNELYEIVNAKLYSVYENLKVKIHEIENYYKEKSKWSKELSDINKEDELLNQINDWEIKYNELFTKYQKYKLYNEWNNNVKQITHATERYENIKEAIKTEKRITLLKRVIAYNEYYSIQDELENTKNKLDKANEKLIIGKKDYDMEQQQNKKAKDITDAYEDMCDNYAKILEFQKLFVGDKTSDGFKQHINKTVIYPLISDEVNKFIRNIDDFKFKIKVRKSNIIYLLEDRGSCPTLDHASGYQKFIVGLAMRLTLSQVGALGQKIPYMFIDEGFLALDSNNIMKTKEIIDLIKEFGDYNTIMMISHLDAIREVADIHLNVVRPEGKNASYIRIGKKRERRKRSNTRIIRGENDEIIIVKKRGRPSKR